MMNKTLSLRCSAQRAPRPCKASTSSRSNAIARTDKAPQASTRAILAGVLQRSKQVLLASGAAALMIAGSSSGTAMAFSDKVASFEASGFLFKDTVEVVSLPDDKVKGVTIYISDFQRSMAERLSKDFFKQPSNASVTCALTGKLAFDEKDIAGKDGQEVFSERKGLNLFQNKTLRVRRIYDAEHQTLLYVAYTTHTVEGHDDAGRYKTSVCAIPLVGNSSAFQAVQ